MTQTVTVTSSTTAGTGAALAQANFPDSTYFYPLTLKLTNSGPYMRRIGSNAIAGRSAEYMAFDSQGALAQAINDAIDLARMSGDAQGITFAEDDSYPLVADASVAGSGVFVADVTITATQLKALNATPITLVAAPGANKALVPILAVFFLDYNSAAYAGIASGEDLTIKYTDGSGTVLATVETTGFLDATADATRFVQPTTAAAFTPVANAVLVAHMASGEITTGDSPLKVRTYYRIIDTAW